MAMDKLSHTLDKVQRASEAEVYKSEKLGNEFAALSNDFRSYSSQTMETFQMRDEDFLKQMIKLDKRILKQDMDIEQIIFTQDKLNESTLDESNRLSSIEIQFDELTVK